MTTPGRQAAIEPSREEAFASVMPEIRDRWTAEDAFRNGFYAAWYVQQNVIDSYERVLAEQPREEPGVALFRAVQQATLHMSQAEITDRVATILRDA